MITANKELLANFGEELFDAAETAGVDLLFEASVAGGIPLMRPLRESLAGERITRVMGIVNGTTNYVLTQMTEEGSSFSEAVAEAQELGYAERDPTADVEGFDAAAKAAIIASIAFGARIVAGDVYREGITKITADDIAAAQGARLRREAARGRRRARRRASARACTRRWSRSIIRSRRCAVRTTRCSSKAEAVGQLMLLGRGAGGGPTASAVLGDLIDAAKNVHAGARGATIGDARAQADPSDRRDRVAVLCVARRRRPARCPRHDRGCFR